MKKVIIVIGNHGYAEACAVQQAMKEFDIGYVGVCHGQHGLKGADIVTDLAKAADIPFRYLSGDANEISLRQAISGKVREDIGKNDHILMILSETANVKLCRTAEKAVEKLVKSVEVSFISTEHESVRGDETFFRLETPVAESVEALAALRGWRMNFHFRQKKLMGQGKCPWENKECRTASPQRLVKNNCVYNSPLSSTLVPIRVWKGTFSTEVYDPQIGEIVSAGDGKTYGCSETPMFGLMDGVRLITTGCWFSNHWELIHRTSQLGGRLGVPTMEWADVENLLS